MVEIASFQQTGKAELLASLLKSEGIACYVRNEVSSRVLGGCVDIGARVELLEGDMGRALKVMEEHGYLPSEEERVAEVLSGNTGLARYIPFLRNFSFEKQIVIFIVLIGGLLALLVYIGSYLSSLKI